MPPVFVLQHAACESLGMIEGALTASDLSWRCFHTEVGDPVPQEIGAAAGLVVLGGSMGVHDQEQYPFLGEELRLIAQAVAQKVPILGVCLGAQLLAFALGAGVKQAEQEIGWHPVFLTAEAAQDPLWHDVPETWTGFHWHRDCFETPPGAVSLASSALTPCQAFRFGRFAYGFQFHLEVTEAIIQDWTAEFAEDLAGAGLGAAPILSRIPKDLPPMQAVAREVFGRWAALAAQRASAG